MSLSDNFADTIELLLAGQFICPYRYPEAHAYLESEAQRERVSQYLREIRRNLRHSADGVAWYAASAEPELPAMSRRLRSQFGEVISQLEPLVRWLNLIMSARHNDLPLSPGEHLKESQLLAAIEDSAPLADELEQLVKLKLFSSQHSSSKGQLAALLQTLVNEGYLLRNSDSGSVYTATGKWSYLYEVMEFVASHEALTSEPVDEQSELPL